MSLSNVIIIGSTGNLGRPVTEAFIRQKDKFTSIAVLTSTESYSSKKDKFAAFEKEGVKVVAVDDLKNVQQLTEAFKGFDVVISTVGFALLNSQDIFVDAAVSAGVKRFYPSEFGGNAQYGSLQTASINQPKLKLAKYLAEKASKNPNFSYTLVATGVFLDYLGHMGSTLAGIDLVKHTISYVGTGTTRFTATALEDIGEFTVASVLKPETSHNKTIEVQSASPSFVEIKELYEKIQGVKYTVKEITLDELEQQIKAAQESDNPWALPIAELTYAFQNGDNLNKVHDEKLYPEVKVHTPEEIVRPYLTS